VILDAAGNIYGTSSGGGGTSQFAPHNGTVFMLSR
jgi:hypothetical protein